ncbi:MAG TPA: MMPL family transporter [Solirubrobacteraceae bacterium]|jgi:RND superfamily putative drug exporter
MRRHRNIAAAAARWSALHRRRAIGGWLAFVLVCFFAGGAVGQRYLTQAQMGNGESGRAARAIDAADFPKLAHEQVLVQGRGGVRIRDASATAAVLDVVSRLMRVPYVGNVASPLAPGVAGQLARDGRSALVTFDVAGDEQQVKQRVGAALAAVAVVQRAHPDLRVEEFGEASANKAIDKSFSSDFKKAERTSLPVTLVILLFAFGSLVAAGIPLLLAITAVIAAIGLLGPLSHLIPVSQGNVGPVVLLIGLAVGVDYSMFYLRRKLEERHAGHDGDSALAIAAATSGRAVLVSGLTVLTAMAGMLLAGNAVFTSMAMGTMLVVAVAVGGSLTVLPAVIAVLGDRVEKGRVPFIAARRARGDSRVWAYLLDRVLRRPALSFALGAALLLALALPALGMRTVDPGFLGLPRSIPIMHTYDRIQAVFPGGPQPSYVVVQARDVTAPAVQGGIARMARAALATREIGGPVGMSVSPDRSVAIVSLSLAGNGTDSRSEAALATLRHRVVPATLGRVPGVKAGVTGLSAGSKDFNDRMKARLPLVFAFVLGLAFLLLLRNFRSVVIAATAIALNLLSVGAAYGVLKLVFQDGHLRSLLGFTEVGGIIDWLPLFLFVVLFGLSMDYHVLILSRIREEHDRGLGTKAAVARGIRSTAGVVTSAAIVMVAVFSIFATLGAVAFKQLGVGLAVAVLLDATVVRGVLLPSAMTLLGDWNWWAPSRPSWLRARRRRAVAA